MMESYLDILDTSLQKKSELLDRILQICKQQLQLLDGSDMTLAAYDAYVDQKSECIDALAKLDEGFELLYQNIAEELSGNRAKYADKIKHLQQLVQEVTDKSVSVQALEARNKSKVEEYFKKEKKVLQSARQTSKAAFNYYQNMNNRNHVEAQFMDQKK